MGGRPKTTGVVQFDFEANLSNDSYRTKRNAYCKVLKDMARTELNASWGIFRLRFIDV